MSKKKFEYIDISRSNHKIINRSLALVDDKLFLAVRLWSKYVDEEGEEKEVEETYFFVSHPNGRIDIYRAEDLKERFGYKIEGYIMDLKRWRINDIHRFIDEIRSGRVEKPNPYMIFMDLKTILKLYIEFQDEKQYELLALWIMGTYFYPLFTSYPYLYIGGVKRAGKTKTLTLIYLTAYNSIFTTNTSTSALFRLIEGAGTTFLMDEAETLRLGGERARDLSLILNSGYKRGAKVHRVEKVGKDKLKPFEFEVYSPKAIASIHGLDDVLEDRCISIIMKRGLNKEIINAEVDIDREFWWEIRDQLYRLTLIYWPLVRSIYDIVDTHLDESIDGRTRELWRPILTMAALVDLSRKGEISEVSEICEVSSSKQKLIQKIFYIVKESSQTSQTSLTSHMIRLCEEHQNARRIEDLTETREAVLIIALGLLVNEDGWYYVSDIRDIAKKIDDGDWINNRWIGRALKRLGFQDKRHTGKGNQWFIKKSQVEDLMMRMGITKEEVENIRSDLFSDQDQLILPGKKGDG